MQKWYYSTNSAQKIFMFLLSLLLVLLFGIGLIPLFILIYLELGARFGRNEKTEENPKLVFASTSALEKALGDDEEFYHTYFYALYHCLPNEKNGITEYRNQLREEFPNNSVKVGPHFVLWGEAAYLATASYYLGLSEHAEPEEFRTYAKERHHVITQRHKKSQSLPVPINLSEGQLCNDEKLDFYTCMAISNGQVFPEGHWYTWELGRIFQ